MGQLLTWYSAHNSIVIQSLSVVIGLLLCFFIFRIFFSSRKAGADSGPESESGLSVQVLENKINQIIESQSKVIMTSKAGSTEGAAEQIEQLQTEIFNLRQTIKEKESAVPTAESSGTSGSVNSEGQGSTEYLKQIEDLRNRLSDYEVIAEDIADLQSLREENQKLQAQLQSLGGGAVPVAATVATAPVTESPIAEPVESPSTQQSASDLDDLLQNITQDLTVSENAQATDEDKDLIQQFEKSKGS
jgi:hypothetical protein